MMMILLLFLIILLTSIESLKIKTEAIKFTDNELVELRDEVKESFLFLFNSYMKYGYPFDEHTPISCKPRSYHHRIRGTLDDVLGNYFLTLIDSLDTLILLREEELFISSIKLLREELKFNTDIDVSVFETNIRILGGLLSAHQLSVVLATNPSYNFEYDGFLLHFAQDIGDRLMPAFATKSGLPYHRINLIHGVRENETSQTCPAAGASFLLEFGLLSRLTNKSKYELTAFLATKAIFDRRSKIDLIGNLIDVNSGQWIYSWSGIGAGSDSFYEYLLKSYILLGDSRLLKMYDVMYDAVQKNCRYSSAGTDYYIEVDMIQGKKQPANYLVSSLSAFFPALQVLAGQKKHAIKNFDNWNHFYGKFKLGIPDIYNLATEGLLEYARGSYSRPEMVESAYLLYTATKDTKYLVFAKNFLLKFLDRRSKCGYHSYSDILSEEKDDRIDSYVLSETLKYLYLIFDEAISESSRRKSFFCHSTNGNQNDSSSSSSSLSCVSKGNTIFTTEGHLFIIDESTRQNGLNFNNKLSTKTCSV